MLAVPVFSGFQAIQIGFILFRCDHRNESRPDRKIDSWFALTILVEWRVHVMFSHALDGMKSVALLVGNPR